MFTRSLTEYLIIVPAVLIAIMVHEVAHGYAAYLLGDSTAKEQGRLNFNPVNHIDFFGMICMILVGFGWAKPVPVNLSNLKNRKWGMPLVALAGPMSNFVLAFFAVLAATLTISSPSLIGSAFAQSFVEFMIILANLCVGLGVFNLIPVPPLDGYNIVFNFLPLPVKKFMFEKGQLIQFGLMALLILGWIDGLLITGRSIVLEFIINLAGAVVGIFH